MSERRFEELTRPPRRSDNNTSQFFVVRNRVGGPVVNETEHKTINWNSDDQIHVLVLYKGLVHVPMHGPPGLDSVPPIVGNVPILVKEVGVRSVVGVPFPSRTTKKHSKRVREHQTKHYYRILQIWEIASYVAVWSKYTAFTLYFKWMPT